MAVKTITVEKKSNELVAWEIPACKDKCYNIVVPGGMKLIEFNNDTIVSINPQNTYEVRIKRYIKQNVTFKFGVYTDSNFDVMVGVGGIPYEDRKRHINTEFGAHGTFTVKIISMRSLYKAFGNLPISKEQIQTLIRDNIRTSFKEQLLIFVEENGGYGKINKELTYISKKITDSMYDKFYEIGLHLEKFEIGDFAFEDSYIDAIAHGTEQERLEKFIDTVSGFGGFNPTPATKPAEEAKPQPAPEKKPERICKFCNNPVGENDKMCRICGRIIK